MTIYDTDTSRIPMMNTPEITSAAHFLLAETLYCFKRFPIHGTSGKEPTIAASQKYRYWVR